MPQTKISSMFLEILTIGSMISIILWIKIRDTEFWLTIDELDNQDEYRFQYSIDFEFLRIADVYAEKILDPYHDQYIPESNYPDLIEYPSGNVKDIVSVFK